MEKNSNLGRVGEAIFKVWCSKAGLVANKANEDLTGWDYLVEFPKGNEEGLPPDIRPIPIECKVQVKATKKKDRKIPITISNLDRLIKSQMPVFICIIEYEENNKEQSVYLVHIWENIIRKTLKRMRQAYADNTDNKLNKKTITITYGEDDQISIDKQNNLLNVIKKYVPNGIEEYLKKKNDFLKKLGFENGHCSLNFKIHGSNVIKDFFDMNLGYNKQVTIKDVVCKDMRFGIFSENPLLSMKTAEMCFPDIEPTNSAIVKIKESKYSPGVKFDVQFYATSIPAPAEFKNLRFKGIFFDILLSPFKNKLDFNFFLDYETRFDLNQLKYYFYAEKILTNLNDERVIEFEIKNHPPFQCTLQSVTKEKLGDPGIFDILSQLLVICTKLNIPENEISVSVHELDRSLDQIKTFFLLINEFKKISIKYETAEVDIDKNKLAHIQDIFLHIGNKIIGCIVSYSGILNKLNQDRYNYELIPDEFFVGELLLLQEGEGIEQTVIDRKIGIFAEKLRKKGYIITSSRNT